MEDIVIWESPLAVKAGGLFFAKELGFVELKLYIITMNKLKEDIEYVSRKTIRNKRNCRKSTIIVADNYVESNRHNGNNKRLFTGV